MFWSTYIPRFRALLSPLNLKAHDISTVLAAKQSILSALNHSAVRSYSNPFGLAASRAYVRDIFTKFSQLNSDNDTLSIDIREAEDELARGLSFCESTFTFLTREFVHPLLLASHESLNSFVSSAKRRLSANIIPNLPPDDTLQKRYPLHIEGREVLISIPMRNEGPSRALGVTAQIVPASDDFVFEKDEVLLGNIPQGDFSLVAKMMALRPIADASLMISITWTQAGSQESKNVMFTCNLQSQQGEVDWASLKFKRPYTDGVAKGAAFVGRAEKVLELATKMLRTPMESFYVTGQKRVGKTSLTLAAAEYAARHEIGGTFHTCYCLWGEIANEPRASLKMLGQKIASTILSTLPPERTYAGSLEFNGSLAELIALVKHAAIVAPNHKYLLILDEFDEFHQELYLQGILAETFFANLRAFSTLDNFCLVLVGGENMPYVMDRQGQKLNRFSRIGLDYYSREGEWVDFLQLVRKPTEGILNWHEEAISEIFNVTNGNPYFTNIICAEIFSGAVRERDADITSEEVYRTVSRQVSQVGSNSFMHLWQDGIHKPIAERDPVILGRRRVLVGLARTLRERQPLTLETLLVFKGSVHISNQDATAILNDFTRRSVLKERKGVYEFVLPVFQLWLTEGGVSQLISDALGEELAQAAEKVELENYVQAKEIEELVDKWPPYQGKFISGEAIRSWLNQVDSNRKARILFTLLQHLHFFDEQKIRHTLRTAHGMLRPILPEFIQKKRSQRRLDLIVTYVDGEGKSGQYYASKYAEENNIGTQSIISPANFVDHLNNYIEKHGMIAAIVIVDDIVATGKSFERNVLKFLSNNQELLLRINVPVTGIALTATPEGEQYVRSALTEIGWLDVDLRICELLAASNFAFSNEESFWRTSEEREEAKALCTDLGATIYHDAPLGFGNQGLLIVFPDTCPNNTLPVLHSYGQSGSAAKWTPLFPRLTN